MGSEISAVQQVAMLKEAVAELGAVRVALPATTAGRAFAVRHDSAITALESRVEELLTRLARLDRPRS